MDNKFAKFRKEDDPAMNPEMADNDGAPFDDPEMDEEGMAMDDKARHEDQENLQERMGALIARLHDEARRRVNKRLPTEQRWIEDLQQYHGIYDREMQERLKESGGSQIFINTTATKTDAMEAKIWDLLFPTDDKNWGISPTPVPELTDGAEAALAEVDRHKEEGNQHHAKAQEQMAAGNVQEAQQAEGQMRQSEQMENIAQQAADALQNQLSEAKRRSDLMAEEIEDQLVTCNFQTQARDAIGDACKIGMGVLKGPVLGEKAKQAWRPDGESGEFVLSTVEDNMPSAYRVDPWSFFPDPDVAKIDDASGCYERHLMSKDQLRKLAKRDDIDKDAVRELLRGSPESGSTPAYMTDLHDLTGQTDGEIRDSYQVWEYTGPVETEDMKLLMDAHCDDTEGEGQVEELDPLQEYHVRVWFCQDKCLSFALHPLDSKESIYSVFTIRRDEATVFGFGVPYIMRHPQSVVNGAWRMMMDNSGLSTGPQIVINKTAVHPEDGNWNVTARKVWIRDNIKSQPGIPAFEAFNIPSNQGEIANIINLAEAAIDDVTAQPEITQGEQGTGVTKTAQGMALLMNNANITFRRIVKNYDDDMTTPIIRRFYHWNMQFSKKEEIKGDYGVQARGSGVLLVREMQAQNLLMIAQMFGDHPVYGPMLKHADLLRQIFKAHMIAADEITKTDREYKEFMQQQQSQQGEADPAMMKLQQEAEMFKMEAQLRKDEMDHKTALAEQEWANRMKIAQITFDGKMEHAAASLNQKRESEDTKLAAQDMDNQHKERSLAVEVAMRERTGKSAGGAV